MSCWPLVMKCEFLYAFLIVKKYLQQAGFVFASAIYGRYKHIIFFDKYILIYFNLYV